MKKDTIQIITDAVRSQALEAVSGGDKVSEVADRFNVSESTIRRWMKKGIPQAAVAVAAAPRTPAAPAAPAKETKKVRVVKDTGNAAPEPVKSVVVIDRDVTYRNGKTVHRSRMLLKGKKNQVVQLVKAMLPGVKGLNMEKVKEDEKAVIEKAANDLFDGNKNLAASYVRDTVDEIRDGVEY